VKHATSNSYVDRKLRRLALEKQRGVCARCRPHKGENQGRRPHDDSYKSAARGR